LPPPAPIASTTLPQGNIVEFFEFDSGVLVSERGKAYAEHTLDRIPGAQRTDLIEIWKAIAPNEPLPAALLDAQHRLAQKSRNGPQEDTAPHVQLRSGPVMDPNSEAPTQNGWTDGAELAGVLGPIGCNNGCCDPSWLLTFSQCHTGQWNWFLFNYWWSTADTVSKVYMADAMACAAIGWSRYRVDVHGSGTHYWWVPEAHFQTFFWLAGTYFCFPGIMCYDKKVVRAHVNIDSAWNLHTQCGSVWYNL
jgi:hypothetical protein